MDLIVRIHYQIEKKENQCRNAACEQKATSVKWNIVLNKKLDLELTMNGLINSFRKKPDPKKIEKTVKIKVKLPHINKKFFCSDTVFSICFKIRSKIFTSQNHSLCRSLSCFVVTKITTPILLQKSLKCVNKSKPKTAPQYNSFLEL